MLPPDWAIQYVQSSSEDVELNKIQVEEVRMRVSV
jgi:hypothetical protein